MAVVFEPPLNVPVLSRLKHNMNDKWDSMSDDSSIRPDFDVLVVGAGVSGINAAYRIQHDAPPNTSYVVLEGRDTIGGTWDVWRYPGIRSDSDIFTFSFDWNPWPGNESIAQGKKIKQYMIDSTQRAGIDRHIRLRHKVVSANWDSAKKCWEVMVQQTGDQGETHQLFRSRFIFLGTGYYDYEEPLHSVIPGIENFEGRVIRPQHWPQDYDYTDKEMVIIGSGATAVSIVPAVAKQVKHVTMLQRSPSWYFPLKQHGRIASVIRALFPAQMARQVNRWRWLIQTQLLLLVCRVMPTVGAAMMRFLTERELPPNTDWRKDFQPRYAPWDQRLCIVMDGDLFAALRSQRASIVTDHIDLVQRDSIVLKSGKVLPADVIVAATGIKLKFGGDVRFSLDGRHIDLVDKFAWKQCMLQDVPNLVFSFGYAENSWTLGANCAATVMVRVLGELERRRLTSAWPRMSLAELDGMEARPLWKLTSTYLKNMKGVFPKGGTGQWQPRGYFFVDYWAARWGGLGGLVME